VYYYTHYKKHPLQKGELTFEVNDEFKEMNYKFYDENYNRRPETGELAYESETPIYF